jgi:orotate phosphoribosyltransferase
MTSLADSLKACGAIKFGDFTLASGKKSSYYVDIKKASTNPVILKRIAESMSKVLKERSLTADYIGGVALGGVPIAVAASLETGIPLVIVRKETKEYGTKGQVVGDVEKGASVVLAEDVATTGGSVLKAIETLRSAGILVKHVIVVVDREEGAGSNLARAGVELIPLVKISDILEK